MPVFSKEKSKLKMVILTKNSVENATWYSPIKQNGFTNDRIMRGMLGRFAQHPLCGLTNMIQFYEDGEKIAEFKPQAK